MGTHVYLKEYLKHIKSVEGKYELPVLLGEADSGDPVIKDLAELKGMLISGSTSSGKSVFLSCVINTIASIKSPNKVKFVLIDPKKDHFYLYEGIEHIYKPVIYSIKESYETLTEILNEIQERKFNKSKFPYIVIMVDEISDLMLSKDDFESLFCKIAEEGVEVGIYLILSTSIPSKKIITDCLQKKIKTRISFSLTSHEDSMVILGQVGAEDLSGSGEMIFLDPQKNESVKLQAPFISTKEIEENVKN